MPLLMMDIVDGGWELLDAMSIFYFFELRSDSRV